MKQFIALIKAGFKTNSPFASLRLRMKMNKRDRIMIPLLGLLVVVAILTPLVFLLLKLVSNLFELLQPIGQTQAILTLVIMAGQLFVLVFGIYYMMSVFYFSRDLEFLIPLPLKPFQVVFSRYSLILVNEYLGLAVLVLPVFIYYGILKDMGLSYWLRLPLVYLLLPIIPLAISSLLVIILMRFVNLGKKKDALMIIGSIFLMLLIMVPQFMAKPGGNQISHDQMVNFLAGKGGFVNMLAAKFPPAAWATQALEYGLSGGAMGFFLNLGVSLLLLLGLLYAGERLFYRGLIGMREVGARKKAVSAAGLDRSVNHGSHPVKAIFWREFRLMNRTPMFLLNGIFTVVLIPGIFLAMFLTKGGNDGKVIINFMTSGKPVIKILAIAGFCVLSGALNGTASSAFSREGGNFWISRVIPVSYRHQVLGKFLHSFLVAGLGIFLASLVTIFMFTPGFFELLAAWLLALTISVAFISIGMAVDINRPLLDWISPQRAIKQNMNVFVAMVVQFGLLAGAGYLGVKLFNGGWNPYTLLVAFFLFFLLLALGAITYLLNGARRKYERVSV